MGRLEAPRTLARQGLFLSALILAACLPGGPLSPPEVALGAAPPGSDLLYVQPVEGITPAALGAALARLGFEVEASAVGPGVRVRVGAGATSATSIAGLARELAETRLVRSVEGDAVVRAAQLPPESASAPNDAAPNDPLYRERQQDYLAAIGAPEAWASGIDASDVLIAIIDTGVDYDHPDLIPRLAINERDEFFDGIDNDGNGCPDDILGCNFVSLTTADPSCGYSVPPPHWRTRDDEGHGTFVSGIAAATGNNETGVTGVAPSARILPVKVLDCTATGRISDAAAGIRYAADMGADVINISFGAPNDSPVLREAINYAQEHGAVIVASAGNDGSRGVTYPAAYPGVLAVAASGAPERTSAGGTDYYRTAPFARFGPGVDYLAPGVDLVSTFPQYLCGANEWACVEGSYAVSTGSSFATPVVAGAVAMMIAAYPEQSPSFVLSLLRSTRHPQLPGEIARLINLGAAVTREVYRAGAPGTSRHDSGDPAGPAAP